MRWQEGKRANDFPDYTIPPAIGIGGAGGCYIAVRLAYSTIASSCSNVSMEPGRSSRIRAMAAFGVKP